MMLDAMLAANDAMAIGPIEARLEKLANRLNKFNKAATLAILAGLLTDPAMHANTVRLEVLIHLVALRSNGVLKPKAIQLREWLNEILGEDNVGRQEDPPEDVFVANVVSGAGNSLLFEGIWESNAGYVQTILYAVTACLGPGQEWAKHCLRQVFAILRLSTAIAERCQLARNTLGGGRRLSKMQFSPRRVDELAGRVRFTAAELTEIGIDPFDLRPFIFAVENFRTLRTETISWTSLEARPIVMDGDDFVVALPTAIGAAVRRRAVEMALGNSRGDLLQAYMTEYQFDCCVTRARIGLGLDQVEEPDVDDKSGFVGMICRFDIGAYAHILFIQDQVDAIAAKGLRSSQDVSAHLRRLVAGGVTTVEALPDFRIGMTIVVFGGLGRGFQADSGPLPGHWRFVSLGFEDFELFSGDSNTSALQMYRLLDQERNLSVRLVNPNGFLNLYGFAKINDFELLPAYVQFGDPLILLDTDHLTSVRTDIRRALDHHAVRVDPQNRYVEVRRPSTERYFASLAGEPLYVSIADGMDGRPVAAIEVGGRTWWITIADAHRVSPASLSYRVWDMAKNWVVMIAPRIAGAIEALPDFIGIELAFPDGTDLSPENIANGTKLIRPVPSTNGQIVRLDCEIDYLRAFGQADNLGDRWMVETILEGALSLAGLVDPVLVEQIASSIVTNTASRYLHVFTPKTAGSFILATAELPHPRMMQSEVRAWADIGLAQRSGVAQGTTGLIEDKQEASSLLGKAVEVIWDEIREYLQLVDRASVIETCIDNHNAIDRDRATWRHTAAAILQLHPREEVMQAAIERGSARSEVGLCCRVVVEMAVCTSPTAGGRICSLNDFDYLMARVSLLCGVASRSDEIHHGFAEKVEIKPSGVLRFQDGFANRIHSPFMVALSRDQFDAAAEGYDSFYEVPDLLDDAQYERQRNPTFDAAFVAEYGISPIRLVDFVSRLGERAFESGNGRITVRRSEMEADLTAMGGVDACGAKALLDAWSLVPRPRWDEPKPADASAKDWYPWRFNRRLSLLAKPIVQLTHDDDPLCVISPVIAEHALEYALRAYDARLPDSYFRSEAMRSWVGGAIDRLGHGFNHKVANRLSELGLLAEAEYLMTRLGGTARDGDVDTLAWDRATGYVFVIECKRLLADKTVGEIAERLVEFSPDHVDRYGRRGPTRRHLDRVVILHNRLPQLAAVTGIPEDAIRIQSCLVTSALVPMQFQKEVATYFDLVSDFDGMPYHFANFRM